MRGMIIIAVSLFSFSGVALAQIPTSGNVFFGYSYVNTSVSPISRTSTNGWEFTAEGKIFPFVGIVADFSSYYGSQDFPAAACAPLNPACSPAVINVGLNQQNYLFGPRVSISISKFRPFAEATIGAGHLNAHAAGSGTSFATALGGGLDYKLFHIIAWRFQGDYLRTRFFSAAQNNVRLSTGIVVRF